MISRISFYITCEKTEIHYQIDNLTTVIIQEYDIIFMMVHVFFAGRKGDRFKVLYREGEIFNLPYKCLKN